MSKRQWAKEFYKDFDGTKWDVCPGCNLYYVKDLPSDQKIHRAHHTWVVSIFDPKPLATLAKLYPQHGQFISVRSNSPAVLRRKLNSISRIFKKEFGCDFTLYDESGDDGHGFIIADPQGRAIGGTTVRLIKYKEGPPRWTFCWIWIAPAYRRKGLMLQTWQMVKDAYPTIEPDPPFSKSAALFFADREDVSERIRHYAREQLKQDRF
jgi:hypothetical protein